MADNVPLSTGPLVVATKDSEGVQHQQIVTEFLSANGKPLAVGTTMPLPTSDEQQVVLLTSILLELRVANEMLYAQMQTEVEPLELMRAKYREYPIT